MSNTSKDKSVPWDHPRRLFWVFGALFVVVPAVIGVRWLLPINALLLLISIWHNFRRYRELSERVDHLEALLDGQADQATRPTTDDIQDDMTIAFIALRRKHDVMYANCETRLMALERVTGLSSKLFDPTDPGDPDDDDMPPLDEVPVNGTRSVSLKDI